MPQKEKQNIIEPAHSKPITTGKHFMQYLNKVEDHLEYCSDSENRDYVQKLETDLEEIGSLLEKVGIIFRIIFLRFSILLASLLSDTILHNTTLSRLIEEGLALTRYQSNTILCPRKAIVYIQHVRI